MAAGQGWVLFAVAAMLLFGAANVVLKLFVTKTQLDSFTPNPIVLALGVIAVAAIAVFIAVEGGVKLDGSQLALAVVFSMLSAAGFLLMLKAVGAGKIAVVNGILAMSTIAVAILSYFFLGDRFGARELAAIALALASVMVLML